MQREREQRGSQLTQDTDKCIDVYAYAIVLLETLTRQPPWLDAEGQKLATREIMQRVVNGERPVIGEGVRAEDQRVVEVVEACWRHDPRQRATFADVCDMFSS